MLTIFVVVVTIALGIVLASIITTALMFVLMGNPKVIDWTMNYYMKVLDKTAKYFEDKEDLGAN